MEIEEQKEKLEEDYNLKMAEVDNMAKSLEPKYADIVAGLVEKITGVVCRDKKDIIVYLIDNALNGIFRKLIWESLLQRKMIL